MGGCLGKSPQRSLLIHSRDEEFFYVCELSQMLFVKQTRLSAPATLLDIEGCRGGRQADVPCCRSPVCVTLWECEMEFNSCVCMYYLSA